MRRLHFLVPDLDTTHKILDELLLARVDERHINVIANDDIDLGDIPEASVIQKSDLKPALQRGLVWGGITGLLAGIALVFLTDLNVDSSGGAVVLAGTLAGAGIGAWFSSLVGIGIPNSHIQPYQQSIERGSLLMMVDVPAGRVDEIKQSVALHHPNARFEGVESDTPVFP